MSSDSLWGKDPLIIAAIATAVIALATIVNLLVAIFMWRVTKESTGVTKSIFEAANRPYVGIQGVNVQKDEEGKRLNITVEIKNFGNVPASEHRGNWDVTIDGISQKQSLSDVGGSIVLFPQASVYKAGVIADPNDFLSIVSGKSVLEFVIDGRYKGVTQKEYYYHAKEQYDYRTNRFLVIEGEIK